MQFSCFRMIASRMYKCNAKNKWLARWFSWNRSKSWFFKLFKCAHSCDTNCLKRCLNSLNFCFTFIKRRRCDAKCFYNIFLNNSQEKFSFINSYLRYHTLKCRLWIIFACIARDRDSCDKSQNVSRKSAYIYAKKYSIHVDFSFDKSQIFSRLYCVYREECFEECFQITKKI